MKIPDSSYTADTVTWTCSARDEDEPTPEEAMRALASMIPVPVHEQQR